MATFKIKKTDGSWEYIGSNSIKVDTSLTQAGMAADAKAVGDAISSATKADEIVTEGSTALITSGAVHTALSNVSVDTSSLVQKSGDTMEGVLVADSISVADLSVAQIRNIWAGTDAPEDLTITWKEGDIYLRYEVES